MAVTKVFNIVLRGKDEASSAIGGVTKTLIGMAASIGAVTLAAKFLKDSILIGAQFGQTMATVGGVMRATADDMENLTAIAREMGATTEFTATQSAEALRFLGMAGFTAEQSIAALPGTLDLATAGNLDLGMAADIATNALTAMGLSVSELGRVNDVLVGTATRTNTTIEMMAEAFKFAAPLARAYGVGIEELSGLIGILANAGIRGSMAGTQLAMAIQMGDKAAKDMGIEAGTLLDVLQRLRDSNASNAEIMEIFGIRAGRAALVLKENIEAARELQKTLANTKGEAQRLAEVMRDTTEGAMKEFGSAWTELQLTVSDATEDITVSVLDMATAFVRAVTASAKIGEIIPGYLRGVDEGRSSFEQWQKSQLDMLLGLNAFGVLLSDINPEIAQTNELIGSSVVVTGQAGRGWGTYWGEVISPEAAAFQESHLEYLRELKIIEEGRAELPDLPPYVKETLDRARKEARTAAMEMQQAWQNMNALVLDGMISTAQALVNTMFGVKQDFAEIFKGMAQDFLSFFLQEILKRSAAKLTAGLLTGPLSFLGLAGVPAAAAPAGIAPAGIAGLAGGPPLTININTVIGTDQYVQETLIPSIARWASLGGTRVGPRGM